METEKVEFTPRPYQTKIADIAKEKNTIIFLPTGSGKTYIAVLVMKHFLSLERRSFSAGGKRCFFIVNTVVLVDQQAAVLERHLPIKEAGRYFGAMNVDNWSRDTWLAEYEAHETLVMTAEIFRMTLAHGFITPSQISVIIFDECHRAVGDSPMLQAARLISERSGAHKPRMIGLSATLLNANAKTLQDARDNVADLLRTFDAVLGCVTGDGVLFFSTNPKEEVISYGSVPVQGPRIEAALEALEKAKRYSGVFAGLGRVPKYNPYAEKLKKTKKDVKNQITDVEVQFENLGVYGGSKAALLAIKLLEFMKVPEMFTPILVQITQAINAMTSMHCSLTLEMSACPENQRAYRYSSPKIQTLIHLLGKVQKQTKQDDFRCLVLVQRKMTARMVCTVLKHIARIPEYSFIKPVFLVGNSGSPDPFPGDAEDFEKMNRHAMKCFDSGEANVLVSTEVTEEGIDIPLCNCVVKFDKILSYRSYMQSKGRARSKESCYFVMETRSEVTSTIERLAEYSRIQDHLTSVVTKTETDADALSNERVVDEKPEIYQTVNATLRDVAAISILNKYISMYNYDRYSIEAPEWKVIKVSGDGRPTCREDYFDAKGDPCQFVAELKLPQSVPVKVCVRSKVKANSKLAKRNAAFEMCKELHRLGELDDNLVPIAPGAHFTPDPSWWPHADITERLKERMKGDRLGTREQGALYFTRVPKCVTNCSPYVQKEAFLHLFKIKPTICPKDRQYRFIFDRVKEDGSFGLLTTTHLPKVCPFPVYSRIGELAVDFIPNYSNVILSDLDLALVEAFSQIFFCYMIPCVQPSEFRMGNGGKDYCLVPTKTDVGGVTSIDWSAVNDSLRLLEMGKPTDEERLTMEVHNETYSGAVIDPWYRGSDKTILIVTRIEQQLSALSPFPDTNCSYSDRFLTEYNVKTLRPDLPLLEAKNMSKCYNGLKKTVDIVKSRSHEEYYVADLVNLVPLSATLWVKAIMMPTILFRLERLLIAEEVRSTIALEASLGYVRPPADFVWQRLEDEETENRHRQNMDSRVSGLNINPAANTNGKPLGKSVSKPVFKPVVEPKATSHKEESGGYKRNFIAELWDADVDAQDTNFLKEVFQGLKFQCVTRSEVVHVYDEVPVVKIPFPRLLRSVGNPEGLQQSKVLTALTAPSANDLVNYERMETLGDSFLKIAVSLFLYEACPLRSEGLLTNLKGKFIGNRNLFNCALNKQLPEVMATRNMPLPHGWFPPKFLPSDSKIVHRKLNNVAGNDLDDLIVKFSNISLKNKPRFVTLGELDTLERTSGTHLIGDKMVADCVEALLGASLLDCGWNGALDVLVWFQIVPETVKRQDGTHVPLKRLLQSGYYEPISQSKQALAKEVDEVQSVLRYTFKEPKILLQALTHPSYDASNSFERLEFIGDAVLDFLITSYIYENCGLLSPGKLTDLRSALVNNVTFAALVAKYGLNRYLLMNSPVLMQAIDAFITSQKKFDHRIDSDLLILCDDAELKISDQITVPKSLADLFEALAGAVFFDCGRDLNIVWKVFYPMMCPVIESFCKDIPIDPVRQLYELKQQRSTVIFEYNRDEINNRMIATCTVQGSSGRHQFHGYGENKRMAKKAVAKFALHSLKNLQNGVCV